MANIIGTWALVRTEAVDANDKPTSVAPFGGTNVIGRVVFTKDGRMSAAITDARSEIPNGENYLIPNDGIWRTIPGIVWSQNRHKYFA